MNLKRIRILVFDEKLKYYLDLIENNLHNFLPKSNNLCSSFIESLNYSVLEGGKRIRPVLTLAVCDMFCGNLEIAVNFACGVELIHAGSLVHDDLPCMDDSEFRRGKPSCHAKFGEAVAVLNGDGLFLSAFEFLINAKNYGASSDQIVKACEVLSKTSGLNGMVLGQAIDMLAGRDDLSFEVVDEFSSLKTSCLFEASCVLGAVAAGMNVKIVNKLDKFAKFFGLAFQVVDDMIDAVGKEEIVGKPVGADMKNDKLNYASILDLSELKLLAETYTRKALYEIKEFENNEFLVFLSKSMLNRVN